VDAQVHYPCTNLQEEIAMMSVAVLVGIVVLLGVILAGIFNRLVALKNRYKNAFSQIEVQLKRRHDLIPNLVDTVKGYMKHERETLDAVIQARNQAQQGLERAAGDPTNPEAMQSLGGAEGALSGAMGRLLALVESYPDLKANTNMMQLSEELTSTENKVSFSRQAFNDSVMGYNTYKQSFPAVVLAGMFGHTQDATLLEFDSEAIAEAPKVSF
jgi:LemA protein